VKVSHLEAFHIAVDFVEPYHLSKPYGTQHEAHAVILEVHTDEGVVGVGEADPLLPFTDETVDSVMETLAEDLAPVVVGADPRAVGAVTALMAAAAPEAATARGAVDMALHDIVGKTLNLGVHALLGCVQRREIPLLFGVSSGPAAQSIATIEAEFDRGHRCFMLKMGADGIDADIERMITVRDHFGDRISLLADANQGWALDEAVQFLERTRQAAPDLLEQPLPRDEIEAAARLRRDFTVSLSADEGVSSVEDAAVLIGAGAADVFSIKVSKHGGIRPSWIIAEMAAAFGVGCLMNSMLEFGVSQAASLQLGCTLSNLVPLGHAYGSVLRLSDDVTDFADNIEDGVVALPDRPGLGVELNRDKLQRYARRQLSIG
jgi:muconate cycloisomerase